MKTLLLDMYGVIIKESKGNFIPYVRERFPNTDKVRFFEMFTKSQLGELSSDDFMTTLGFADPQAAKRDYIENHLTLDEGFIPFAEQHQEKYRFALLSNDVLAWSETIRAYYGVGRYFGDVILSANTGVRKPDRKIFEIAIERLGVEPADCIFVDNSVKNLLSARSVGMGTVLFNRDSEEYDGRIVNDFDDLAQLLQESEAAK
jgi:putative hydrolase of the HAD superfamily